jgi:hypothetical protein
LLNIPSTQGNPPDIPLCLVSRRPSPPSRHRNRRWCSRRAIPELLDKREYDLGSDPARGPKGLVTDTSRYLLPVLSITQRALVSTVRRCKSPSRRDSGRSPEWRTRAVGSFQNPCRSRVCSSLPHICTPLTRIPGLNRNTTPTGPVRSLPSRCWKPVDLRRLWTARDMISECFRVRESAKEPDVDPHSILLTLRLSDQPTPVRHPSQ